MMFFSKIIAIAACILLAKADYKALPSPLAPTQTASLTIRTTNLRNNKGTWRIAVYNSPKNFLGDIPPFPAIAPIRAGKSECTITNLPAGDYQIAVFHDENNNLKMDYWLGVPSEGVGFSNNPSIWGKPSYEECTFSLKAGEVRGMSITMKYLL